MGNSTEQRQPGCDAEQTRLAGIETEPNAMLEFCADMWYGKEKEALQVVRADNSYPRSLPE